MEAPFQYCKCLYVTRGMSTGNLFGAFFACVLEGARCVFSFTLSATRNICEPKVDRLSDANDETNYRPKQFNRF